MYLQEATHQPDASMKPAITYPPQQLHPVAELLPLPTAASPRPSLSQASHDMLKAATPLLAQVPAEEYAQYVAALANMLRTQGSDIADRSLLSDLFQLLSQQTQDTRARQDPPEMSSVADSTPGEPGEVKTLSYPIYAGCGAAPTALLRSATFSSPKKGAQAFPVLGIKNVTVERGSEPLTHSDLMTLAYLVSLVKTYDSKFGVALTFNPWDAVRTLRWTHSPQSVTRLHDAIEVLSKNTVRIVDTNFAQEEAAPFVARRVFAGPNWEVHLTVTLLTALERFRTFINFEVLSKLPNGAASSLYLFISSEKSQITEWPLDALAELAGLSSANKGHIKRKMTEALETLKLGSHTVKTRGKSLELSADAKCETKKDGSKVFRATEKNTVTYPFPPILESFEFRLDRNGKERVALTKVPPARAKTAPPKAHSGQHEAE